MEGWAVAAVLGAGGAAGAINAVVGSGTLITFPTLLALGYPAVTANISNNIGLVWGGLSSTWAYRRELRSQRRRAAWLLPASGAGALTGALLLLRLPPGVFRAVVPVLIALSLVLVVAQPRIARRTARRAAQEAPASGTTARPRPLLALGVLATGVYGGYFGAAQGLMLLGLLGTFLSQPLQSTNALKNLLATMANAVATTVFLMVAPAHVDWAVTGLIALGATVGGHLGARIARHLPPRALRLVILTVGLLALARLLLS